MENNEEKTDIDIEQSGKLLRNMSYLLISIFLIIYVIFFIIAAIGIKGIMTPNTPGSWEALGEIILIVVPIVAFSIYIPTFITALCGIRYSKNKGNVKLESCITWGYISLFINSAITLIIAFRTSLFQSVYGEFNTEAQIKFCIINFLITCLPIVLYLLGCYQQKHGKRCYLNFIVKHKIACGSILLLPIICIAIYVIYDLTIVKIPVKEENLSGYQSFINELKSRNIIYDLPSGKKELTSSKRITAIDNKYEYEYDLGVVGIVKYNGEPHNRKFPLYVYDGYTSLIQKSSKTNSSYYKGLEDWTINWYIYYINGQIYAAIGDESAKDTSNKENVFKTKYKAIISETEKIITYNKKRNYYSYGGGIIDTTTSIEMPSIPMMRDKLNSKCAKIRVVNRVDAKTLDNIAKKVSQMN